MTATPSDLLLPDDVRLLHIGPQKTGSTALQAALHENRTRLLEHGVSVVGTDAADRKALWAALRHHESTDERYRARLPRWDAMVEQVAAAPGRVVLSHESLGKADAEGAERMVEALGGDRVHVLAVARRLDRLLPSQWQQRVKMNATSLSYEQWLQVVLGDDRDDPLWRNIWVPHDLEGLVRRWTDAANTDRFTLLVADESDRALLSRTVEQLLGLPDGVLRPQEGHKDNVSLSYGRLEFARMLTHRLEDTLVPEVLWRQALRAIKQHPQLPDEQRMPGLPEWARARVAELSDTRAKLVRSLGVRVVGDPDALRMPEVEAAQPAATRGVVPAELAAFALATALELAADREQAQRMEHANTVRRLRGRVRRLRGRLPEE